MKSHPPFKAGSCSTLIYKEDSDVQPLRIQKQEILSAAEHYRAIRDGNEPAMAPVIPQSSADPA